MKAALREGVVFPAARLLPPAWRHFVSAGPLRAFNPGLLRDGDGWLFAYRIVGADLVRRIGLCRLDRALDIVDDTAVPLSDLVQFPAGNNYPEIATRWFADPRLYRLAGRLFVYWNSGWHEPRNHQFLQELDPATRRPMAHPRELVLRGERRTLEKNWTLFEAVDGSGRLFAIYSVSPHRVLEFALHGAGDIEFTDFASTEWSPDTLPPGHGGLRGGAPPFFSEGCFWSICHRVHDAPHGHRYAAAAYRFSAHAPFAPVDQPVATLELGNPFGGRRSYPRLNPAVGEVIYPCGAARDGPRWLISHGINDEHCAISSVSNEEIIATLKAARLTS